MSAKRFWPGYQWRILAHVKTRTDSKGAYTGERVEWGASLTGRPEEFDELVIDDWLHLEQQTARDWWIGVGNQDGDRWMINVHVDATGAAKVMVEQDG